AASNATMGGWCRLGGPHFFLTYPPLVSRPGVSVTQHLSALPQAVCAVLDDQSGEQHANHQARLLRHQVRLLCVKAALPATVVAIIERGPGFHHHHDTARRVLLRSPRSAAISSCSRFSSACTPTSARSCTTSAKRRPSFASNSRRSSLSTLLT